MNTANTGRFVWYELMTTDVEAAKAFYGHVIGWKTQPFEGQDYTMWVGSQGPLGGVMLLPEQAKAMGAPPHWMSNVVVDDVDATVAKVRSLDGRIFVEPQDIPTVGRFAIIGDPQGGTISAFKPASPMEPHDNTKPGEFTWSELTTTNREGAFSFYSQVFGWKKQLDHDMGPMGIYTIFGVGDKQLGGMFQKTKDMPMPTAWLYYVDVADLDAAIARSKEKGAKLLNGPMEVPGGARIAQLMDPQGAAYALHEQPKSKA